MKVNKVKAICEIQNNIFYVLYLSICRDSSCLVLWLVSVTVNKTKFFFPKHNFHKARKYYPILYRNQQRLGIILNGMARQHRTP